MEVIGSINVSFLLHSFLYLDTYFIVYTNDYSYLLLNEDVIYNYYKKNGHLRDPKRIAGYSHNKYLPEIITI